MEDATAAATQALERASGRRLAGAFAFGDSQQLADELLALVRVGRKRATAGVASELPTADQPFPEAGQSWGLLDGRGKPCFVMKLVEVRVGRLDTVDPAFAWDEGENDRTYEGWLDAHRCFFRRQGVDAPDALDLTFERFRLVWPDEDAVDWLAEGVRACDLADRSRTAGLLANRHGADFAGATNRRGADSVDATGAGSTIDPRRLPALVIEHRGQLAGLLTFRPWPGGLTDVITVDVTGSDASLGTRLRAGMAELARRERWDRVRWPDEG